MDSLISREDGKSHSPRLYFYMLFPCRGCLLSSLLFSLACLLLVLQHSSRLCIHWGAISESVSILTKPGCGPGIGLCTCEGAVPMEDKISVAHVEWCHFHASKVCSSCHSIRIVCLLTRLPHWTWAPCWK